MAIVYIPTQLRPLTGGIECVVVPGTNLRQVIAALDAAHPGLGARLCGDDGISPGLAVSIDGAFTNRGLLAKVGPDSEIHFLPAIGGG
ncbi:MAG TPA: MoaD/ThiS family protein [Pirellulales bacterium]|nr:MoaD/ThiS family protein [Pirellulales bacterium]